MGYATEHLKPWQGRELWSSGALEQHGATRPRGRALRKGFLKPLGDKPSSEGRHWPAKQVGVGAVGPEPTPARSGASMEPATHLSSFTNVQPALGNPSRTTQGSVTHSRCSGHCRWGRGRLRASQEGPKV